LTDWSLKKPIVRLNSERFKHFVRTAPRNYSMIVMLTALSPSRQCGICKYAFHWLNFRNQNELLHFKDKHMMNFKSLHRVIDTRVHLPIESFSLWSISMMVRKSFNTYVLFRRFFEILI